MSSEYILTPCLTASGNINPSVFVMLDGSNDQCALQATANARTIGVSGRGSQYAPGTNTITYEATSGNATLTYGLGSICMLTVGTGGWSPGNLLESDANGNGVVSTTAGHNVGAIALTTGNAGEQRPVQVVFSNHP